MNEVIEPRYKKQSYLFNENGFEFVEYKKPYDIYKKDDEFLLYCMPCMILCYLEGGKTHKMRGVMPHTLKDKIKVMLIK